MKSKSLVTIIFLGLLFTQAIPTKSIGQAAWDQVGKSIYYDISGDAYVEPYVYSEFYSFTNYSGELRHQYMGLSDLADYMEFNLSSPDQDLSQKLGLHLGFNTLYVNKQTGMTYNQLIGEETGPSGMFSEVSGGYIGMSLQKFKGNCYYLLYANQYESIDINVKIIDEGTTHLGGLGNSKDIDYWIVQGEVNELFTPDSDYSLQCKKEIHLSKQYGVTLYQKFELEFRNKPHNADDSQYYTLLDVKTEIKATYTNNVNIISPNTLEDYYLYIGVGVTVLLLFIIIKKKR